MRLVAEPFLFELAGDLQLLANSIEHTLDDQALVARCESTHIYERITLFQDYGRGCSVRLQQLYPEDYDRPHNHRMSFSTVILAGTYVHTFFARGAEVDSNSGDRPMLDEDAKAIEIDFERVESAGSSYTIHHRLIHSTKPSPDHLSLMVCGPPAKDRLFFFDERRGGAQWHYGGAKETDEQVRARQMSRMTIASFAERVLTV